MAIKLEPDAWQKFLSTAPLQKAFLYSVAVILTVIGVILLYTATGQDKSLHHQDALLGISNRASFVLMGLIHLAFGVYLFMARYSLIKGLLTLWMGLYYFVYREGMVLLMKVALPFGNVQSLAKKIGVNPRMADSCWKLLIAGLIMGSILQLALGWRRSRLSKFDASIKSLKQSA